MKRIAFLMAAMLVLTLGGALELKLSPRHRQLRMNYRVELKRRDLYSPELLNRITRTGNIRDTDLPAELKELYVTALEIDPEWHVRMQAAFQKHVDNAVSKTVNMPREASVEDVKKVYRLAYELKCKGITVFRQGSKEGVFSEGGISESDLAECQSESCYL